MDFFTGFGFLVLVVLLAVFLPRASFVVAVSLLAINSGIVSTTSLVVPISVMLALFALAADIVTLVVFNDL